MKSIQNLKMTQPKKSRKLKFNKIQLTLLKNLLKENVMFQVFHLSLVNLKNPHKLAFMNIQKMKMKIIYLLRKRKVKIFYRKND
jgi:hypothetical protein